MYVSCISTTNVRVLVCMYIYLFNTSTPYTYRYSLKIGHPRLQASCVYVDICLSIRSLLEGTMNDRSFLGLEYLTLHILGTNFSTSNE